MLRSDLCDYADAYIPVKGRITIIEAENHGNARRADEINQSEYLKIVHHLLNA